LHRSFGEVRPNEFAREGFAQESASEHRETLLAYED